MGFGAILAESCRLGAQEGEILDSQVVSLDRRARRIYHRALEPRLPEFRAVLARELRRCARPDSSVARQWATEVACAVHTRGFVTIAEQLVIDLVGRQAIAEVLTALRGAAKAR